MSGAGKRVVVTGGSGGAGLFIIPELLAHGYTVVNADRQQEPRPGATFVSCDSTVLDQVVNVTAGAYAIVHMAAIASPTPPDQEVWRVNMTGAWNVLEAAEIHGIKKVVMASSVNALGADWGDKITPEYFPIDEDHPTRAQDVYSVSKHLAEELADSYARRRSVQIASLRFHWLMRPEDAEGTYKANLADTGDNIEGKCRGFWSWTGRHGAARACRLSIEAEWEGHEAFFINGHDTTLTVPSVDAIKQAYPGVPIDLEYFESHGPLATVLSIDKAKKFMGWEPEEDWRLGAAGFRQPTPEPEGGYLGQGGYTPSWHKRPVEVKYPQTPKL